MTKFCEFLCEDAGAITVDWLPLTFGAMISGLIVLFSIFNNGVGPVVEGSEAVLQSVVSALDPGPSPDINK